MAEEKTGLGEAHYREAQCCATCEWVECDSVEWYCGKLLVEVDSLYVCDDYKPFVIE